VPASQPRPYRSWARAEHKAALKVVAEAAARRADETADAAAFVEGEALDRIVRYRSAHERSLARSLDALARLTA
jgi:hypothetical protein